MKRIFLALFLMVMLAVPALACTSVIFSSRVMKDGRPLMWKNRDTDSLDNCLRFYSGEIYDFNALVNAVSRDDEVWTGVNTAGFAIMNTASYNIKDDDVPQEMMDREGRLMFRALEICACTEDFEHFLDTCSRPMGVEANFGVIDASGGASFYEVNNHGWVRYDVNDPAVAPRGYLVVTNFSFSGRVEDRKGCERFSTANAILEELTEGQEQFSITPYDIVEKLSRSLRHDLLGKDYLRDYDAMMETGFFNGIVVDQDFIPRRSTSSATVIHGVRPGSNPFHTVMWTLLGYPFTAPVLPVPVSDRDIIPSYMKGEASGGHSPLCDLALLLKYRHIFRFDASNGSRYMDITSLVPSANGESLLAACQETERSAAALFDELHGRWTREEITADDFYFQYRILSESFFNIYTGHIEHFL